MLKYLIQVVAGSLTTGILLAMLFALVHISSKDKPKDGLFWGFIIGVASALILSVLKYSTVLINREYFNIVILSVAILAEIIFYMLSWGAFRTKTPEIREKIWNVINAVLTAALLLYCLPDIFLYPTEFVMSGESALSTDFLFKLIGYLGGLLIVGLSGFALYKAGTGLSYHLVRALLTIGLAVNMVNQITTIVQFLLARRIIPMSKWLFALIKPVINYNEYFLYALMLITIFIPLRLWLKSRHPGGTYANPAQHRKIRAASRGQRRWCAIVAAGYILAVLSLTVIKAYDGRETVLSPAEPMSIVGHEIVIPLENINDGHLHRFVYTAADGTEVRFIIIKKNAVAYGVGLDACDICGPTGYYERKDEVVCKLCDVVMNISTIGFKGGCNPVPLAYTLAGGKMVIQTQHLENEKNRFK
jgi:uncharacterized membrane protein